MIRGVNESFLDLKLILNQILEKLIFKRDRWRNTSYFHFFRSRTLHEHLSVKARTLNTRVYQKYVSQQNQYRHLDRMKITKRQTISYKWYSDANTNWWSTTSWLIQLTKRTFQTKNPKFFKSFFWHSVFSNTWKINSCTSSFLPIFSVSFSISWEDVIFHWLQKYYVNDTIDFLDLYADDYLIIYSIIFHDVMISNTIWIISFPSYLIMKDFFTSKMIQFCKRPVDLDDKNYIRWNIRSIFDAGSNLRHGHIVMSCKSSLDRDRDENDNIIIVRIKS